MFLNIRNKMIPKVLMLVTFALLTGCATADIRVVPLYEPSGLARGGNGDFYLALQNAPQNPGNSNTIQWVLGGISDKDGERLASIVSARSPGDMLIDAFTQELKSGGFRAVQVAKTLPEGVGKGLRIVDSKIRLDEIKSVINVEVTCSVQLTVEAWRNGKVVKTLKYDAEITNSKINDRERIVPDTLQKTLQRIMTKAVPEITSLTE